MNTSHFDSYDSDLDCQSLSAEAIQLSDEEIEQAQVQARQVKDPAQLWPIYLNELARLGFEQWLQTRFNDAQLSAISGRLSNSSQSSPGPTATHLASELSAQFLNINGFRVCLLPQATQPDEMITLPKATVDDAKERAHFFVIAAITEEQGCVEIYAVLRQDQLIQQRSRLTLNTDQTYAVPLSWFNPDANSLLLYLRCSEPAAFEQAGLQTVVGSSKDSSKISDRLRTWSQAAVNTALWLEGELDDMAQTLAWRLLPPPQLQAAMRSSSGAVASEEMPEDSNYDRLIQALRDRNVQIPADARPAYQDLDIAGQTVRLYALSWPIQPEGNHPSEWTLVVVVGPLPQQPLPRGICLTVEDQDQALVQRQFDAETDEFLFAEVVGGLNEIFRVKLQLNEQLLQTLPVFSFQPRQSVR